MDKLGQQGLSKVLSASGSEVLSVDDLHKLAPGGGIIGNAVYYQWYKFHRSSI